MLLSMQHFLLDKKTPILLKQFLPGVVEDVVHHIAGKHVFMYISLQNKEYIAESPSQPPSVSVYKHMQHLLKIIHAVKNKL